jgi:hypothetical protein
MKYLIKKILKEELIVESGGAFSEALAVDLWKNVLAYPQSKTKKTYNYLGVVKGETAFGALHWTTSGFPGLYNIMGDTITQKHFNKSVDELINFSKEVDGGELDYSWWEDGIRSFIDSPENEEVQNKAIHDKFSKKFSRSKYGSVINKWTTPREFAIGMSLINSAPACFLRGNMYGWDAEEMMRDYCKGTGKKSDLNGEDSGCGYTRGCRGRCKNVNKFYPTTNNSGYVWDDNEHKKYCRG